MKNKKKKAKQKSAKDRPRAVAAPGSPEFARQILAQAQEAYRLARRDRPRENHQPLGYSGDAAILSSHELMNRRTRDFVRNTAQAKSIIMGIVDLVMGCGLQTFAWPFAPAELFSIIGELESLQGGLLGPRLTYALESDDLFEEWSSDPAQFDVEGRLNQAEMLRLALADSATVGTCLIVRNFVSDYQLVPLAYQLIEREQIDESQDRVARPGENKIIGGRELDERNRVVAYHIFTEHPQDSYGSALFDSRQRVPAERVIDLSLFHRPSASGGISWLDACGQSVWDRDSYVSSEIQSAAIDAVFALVAHLDNPHLADGLGFDDGGDDTDSNGNRSFKLGRSPVASVLGKEEKLEMVQATRPNRDAPTFLKYLDQDVAAGTPLSYYTLTGNYEATNYTSAKGAKQDEDLHIRPLQTWLATHAALPIRRAFNAIAAAHGVIESVSPVEFQKNIRTYQRFDAIGNGRDLIDPYKEGEARTTRLRTCMSTFKEECAKTNKHWIRVLMQIAVEQKVAKLLGVLLDFAKGGGSGGNTTGQLGDDQVEQLADRVAMLLEDKLRVA